MLLKDKLRKDLREFIISANNVEQDNVEEAIDRYAAKMEQVIYDAIKSLTVTIPAGAIQVQGTATNQTNTTEIVLNNIS